MEKKFPICKLVILIVWLMLGVSSVYAAWDGTSMEKPTKVGNVCTIDSEAKLAWYAAASKDNNYTKCDAKLTVDLDMGGKLWTPIAAGTGEQKFAKIFDGDGHIIKNLYINGTELAAINSKYAQNLGFVGTLGGGTIKNLVLENVDIQASTNAGTILTNADQQISVGAFVGWMAEVNNNLVDNCMVTGTIKTTGNSQGVGGIVGNAKKGTITNCLSLVEIQTSGSKANIGGIIGITKTDVSISSCVYAGPGLYNTGTGGSVGGIAGNVWSGTMSAEDSYYESENITYNGSAISGIGNICNGCSVTTTAVKLVDESNVADIACALNGMEGEGDEAHCKTEPWSVGETSLSLNGYGTDGYKIVFDANGGVFANGKANKDKFLDAGMAITADEIGNPSRDYYSFVGWALTRTATEPAENLGVVSQRDTVFAVWEKKIKVTFDANGGTFPDESVVKNVYITKNNPITVDGLGSLPVSYCIEYSVSNPSQCVSTMYFTGWKDDAGTTIDFNNHDILATEDVTYNAIWTDVKTYSVTFHANNNTTVDIVVYVDDGETLTSRPTDPTMDGYDFVDWFDGDAAFNFGSQIESSKDLYAHWTPKQYNVTYVLSDGGLNKGDNPVIFTLGEGLLALNPPTAQDGYTFDGWFYDSDFKQKATAIDRNVVGDKTFYAKWSKMQYRVMYLADNNSYGSISDQFVEHGSSITLESAGIFRRAGYEQTGWSTTMDGAKEYDFGESVTVVAPITLYPTWNLATYTITYECDGCVNDPTNPTTYTYNDQPGIKFAQAPEGYSFAGWFKEPDFQTQVTQIKKNSYGDITLYGKQLVLYKITYVGTDNAYGDKTYTSEKAALLRTCAPREGFTFVGWYDNPDFEGDAVTEVPLGSSGDKTFYARWATQVTKYGAVTIYVYEDKPNVTEAVIDGNYGDKAKPNVQRDAVAIPGDIQVNSVVMTRSFTVGKYSTIVLPFDVNTQYVQGLAAVLYYNGIKIENGTKSIRMKVLWAEDGCIKGENGEFVHYDYTNMRANTPYMLLMKNETFAIKSGAYPITLKETTAAEENANNSGWTFRGTWQYKEWGASGSDQETGYAYGFAASQSDENNIDVGDFVKVGAGAWIRPMRAYLVNTSRMQQMARANGAYVKRPSVVQEELPEIMSIVIDNGRDDDEQTTVIGHLNTRTGEIKMIPLNRTFDVKGRNVGNKANKARGAYYGKKSLK